MLRKQRGFPGAEPRKCQELRHEEVTSDGIGNDKHRSARQGSEMGEHRQKQKIPCACERGEATAAGGHREMITYGQERTSIRQLSEPSFHNCHAQENLVLS